MRFFRGLFFLFFAFLSLESFAEEFNRENCVAKKYSLTKVLTILHRWENSENSTLGHRKIIGSLKHHLMDLDQAVLICDSRGELVSLALVDFEENTSWIEIELLISTPEVLRKGFGRAAVKGVVELAVQFGKKSIRLLADESAKPFYTKLHFTVIDEFKDEWELKSRDFPLLYPELGSS